MAQPLTSAKAQLGPLPRNRDLVDPEIERFEAKADQQLAGLGLGCFAVARHEHHRALGQTVVLRHYIGADLIKRLDDLCKLES